MTVPSLSIGHFISQLKEVDSIPVFIEEQMEGEILYLCC